MALTKPEVLPPIQLRLQLLGEFRMEIGGELVTTIQSSRLQALLAYLTLHRAAPQRRQHIAFLFWPDTTETQARTNLRKLLHHLHQAFPAIGDYLLIEKQNLLWRPGAPISFDVADFETAAAAARASADDVARCVALEHAASLYGGDLLPGCYDDWIRPEREQLRQLAIDTLSRLVDLLEAQRAYREAVRYGQRLLQFDSANEDACCTLMRLHALSGDRAAALRVYHACVTALEDELGVEPSQDTVAIYERLLHAPDLAETVPNLAMAHTTALVGRQAEWNCLQQAWQIAGAGCPYCVLVSGDAGIGKTRLADELAVWAQQQGYVVAVAKCYAAQGSAAYAPVVAWLRSEAIRRGLARLDPIWLSEVSRLLPELLTGHPSLPPPVPLHEPWRRHRFFEALARAVLSTAAPVLLILDNAHWCDDGTLAWLHYLLRYAAKAPLLVLGTARSEELDEAHPLNEMVAALHESSQASVIELAPLNAAETAQLATQLAGIRLEVAEADMLYRETEGNPLFIVETLRSGWLDHASEKAAMQLQDPPLESPLPPTIHAVIARQFARLSPDALELAGVAAAVGRSFAFEVLAQASLMDEDRVVRGLDELWRRRVVREHGVNAYDFTHDKLREVAYRSLSTARRRLVHRRVAQAIESMMARQLDAVAGQLAYHFDKAGMGDQAIAYYRRAAEAAQHIFANDEAIRYYRRALELVGLTAAASVTSATLHEQYGDVHFLVTHYDAAREAYRLALEQLPAHEFLGAVRLQRKIANSLREQYQFPEALRVLDHAQQVLHDACGDLSVVEERESQVAPDPACFGEWVQVNCEALLTYYWTGRVEDGFALLDRLWPATKRYGSPPQQAQLLRQEAMLALRRDRYAASDETLAIARAIFFAQQQMGEQSVPPAAYFQYGFFLLWHGDFGEAEEKMQTSLDLADQTGDLSLQARCLTYLTIICRRRGQVEETRRYAERSFVIASAANMPEYQGMACANQAWLAWLVQDWDAVDELGRAALAFWRQAHGVPGATVFAWAAHWPLLAAAFSRQAYERAVDHVVALLDPQLQRMPDALIAALERARQAGGQPDADAFHNCLRHALALAHESGYL